MHSKIALTAVALAAACTSSASNDRDDASHASPSDPDSGLLTHHDGGSSTTDSSHALTCSEAERAWTQGFADTLSAVDQCSQDSDCAAYSPDFRCSSLELRGCAVAFSKASADLDTLVARSKAIFTDLCQRAEPDCTLPTNPCPAVGTPRCNQSRCVLEPTCNPDQRFHPDRIDSATPSPDGQGFCCAASTPTCSCGVFGGFVQDRCDCGTADRPGVCDLAPPDWVLTTDPHGCPTYSARSPTTACCNCPPAATP